MNKLLSNTTILLNLALFISTVGSTGSILGFITYVFNKTNNALDTGAITIFTLLVGLFIGPFLGVLVNKKGFMWSMVVPELISGILMLLFCIYNNINLIYLIVFIIGINNKILGIARLSFIPYLTTNLIKFNSSIRAINRIAMILGSLMFSLIVNYSINLLFFIDAITFFLSAYFLYLLNKKVKTSDLINKNAEYLIKEKTNILLQGYKILFLNNKINYIVVLGILARVFYAVIPTMLIILIKDVLYLDYSIYGYTQAISRTMSFIVFIIIAKYVDIDVMKYFKKLLFIIFMLYGVTVYSIGYAYDEYTVYIVYGISEICLFLAVVLIHSYIQSILTKHEMTLASGSVSTGFSIGAIISIVFFTKLSEYMSPNNIFHICGIGLIASVILVYCLKYCKWHNLQQHN